MRRRESSGRRWPVQHSNAIVSAKRRPHVADLARALWIVSYAIRFGVNNQKQNFQSVSIPDFFIQSEPLE
jgi:hypothetical protein